jgi:hypothetical protein
LVTAIGGNGSNIRAFMEGLATDNNLRLAILQMPLRGVDVRLAILVAGLLIQLPGLTVA